MGKPHETLLNIFIKLLIPLSIQKVKVIIVRRFAGELEDHVKVVQFPVLLLEDLPLDHKARFRDSQIFRHQDLRDYREVRDPLSLVDLEQLDEQENLVALAYFLRTHPFVTIIFQEVQCSIHFHLNIIRRDNILCLFLILLIILVVSETVILILFRPYRLHVVISDLWVRGSQAPHLIHLALVPIYVG